MELQHVNIQLLAKGPDQLDLAPIVPIFHSWIQSQALEGQLLDVADYRHVTAGPGVVLIGHEGDYSIDNTDSLLGVRYNRKTPLEGTDQDRLSQATRAAICACQLLQKEPAIKGQLQFNRHDIEVSINDRLLAPNRAETSATLEPEFRAFAGWLFAGAAYSLSFSTDRRRLFAALLSTSEPIALDALMSNLDSRRVATSRPQA